MCDRLVNLITGAKKSEQKKQQTVWQNKAIRKIEKYWKSKSHDGKLNGKIGEKFLTEVLGKEDWKEDIRNETDKSIIKSLREDFIKKIKDAKSAERQRNGNVREKYEEENKLDEKLEKLKQGKKTWFYQSNVEKLFDNLEQFINGENGRQFLKEVCGKVSDKEKEKIISEIKKDKNIPIEKKEDFEKSPYFKNIKKDEIEEYIKEINKIMQEAITELNQIELDISNEKNIVNLKNEGDWDNKIKLFLKNKADKLPADKTPANLRTIRQNRYNEVEREIAELEKMKKKNVSSLLEKSKKLAMETKSSQKEIENVLKSFNGKVEELSTKKEKNLISDKEKLETENLIVKSTVGLVEKIKEVKEAIKIVQEISENYLKGKEISEEEIQTWNSELKKLESSEKVSQHWKNMIEMVQTKQKKLQPSSTSKNVPNWIKIGGLILGVSALVVFVGWINTKRNYMKQKRRN